MCGIAGIASFKGKVIPAGLINSMIQSIRHRGPDGEGFYINRNIQLGHCRLSIIDINCGSQPMYNEDRSVVVVQNGEIYNFVELKSDLTQKGHRFKTKSDTEVIIHGYEEYGVDFIVKLNGMFAFALYDIRSNKLILARDRLGVKPLYYFLNDTTFAFASEIKALLEIDGIKREMNPSAAAQYLRFQNVLNDETFFKNIYKLKPGNFALLSSEGEFLQKPFWRIAFNYGGRGGYDDYLSEYGEVFKNAVKRHLIGDVEVGCYLSGGFDSSSVSYFASTLSDNRIKSFTGAFSDGQYYDERSLAGLVSGRLGLDPYEIVISAKDLEDNLQKIIYHLDEPIASSGNFAQYFTSGLVSKHIKVVLTGHGGDELFAGYHVYKSALFKSRCLNPLFALSFLKTLKKDELARFLYFLLYPVVSPDLKYGIHVLLTRGRMHGMLSPDFSRQVNSFDGRDIIEDTLRGLKLNGTDRLLFLYLSLYLPNLLLVEDKVGMAHSIEARTPILDNEMVDFALKTPIGIKMHNNELKSLTKDLMRDKLPQELYNAPKRGFPTPIVKWFRGDLSGYVKGILLDQRTLKRGFFDPVKIKKIIHDFHSRKSDNLYDYAQANLIYSLLSIEVWSRAYLDKKC